MPQVMHLVELSSLCTHLVGTRKKIAIVVPVAVRRRRIVTSRRPLLSRPLATRCPFDWTSGILSGHCLLRPLASLQPSLVIVAMLIIPTSQLPATSFAATVAAFVFAVGLGQNDFALISSRAFVLDASSMTSQWMACIQGGYIHLKGVPCLLPSLLAHNPLYLKSRIPQEGPNPLAGITCPPDSGVFMKCEGCVNGLPEQGIFF